MRGNGDVADGHPYVDPLPLKHTAYRVLDIRVLTNDQVVGMLKDRNLRSEAPVHLGELQADIAAAHHDEVLRNHVERHHRGVRQKRRGLDSGPIGDGGAPAGIDEDPGRRQGLAVDAHFPGRGKRGLASDHLQIGRALKPARQPLDGRAHDRILAGLDRLGVDTDRPAQHHSVFACASRHVRDTRAGHQGFGRDAAVVDAGAAQVFALDERCPMAGLGQPHRQERTGLAAADNDGVECPGHGLPSFRGRTMRDRWAGTEMRNCEQDDAPTL